MILSAAGFNYDLFNEPFNPGKLAIDVGAFAAIYVPVSFIVSKFQSRRAKSIPTPSPRSDSQAK